MQNVSCRTLQPLSGILVPEVDVVPFDFLLKYESETYAELRFGDSVSRYCKAERCAALALWTFWWRLYLPIPDYRHRHLSRKVFDLIFVEPGRGQSCDVLMSILNVSSPAWIKWGFCPAVGALLTI